jgi:phosphoglycolate phosphatase
MTRSRPAALLFDWDNTLVDTWPVIHDAINHTLVAMGHPAWTFGETKRRVRLAAREAFPILFGEEWEKAAAIFYERILAAHIERLTAVDGAAEMLETAHEMGFILGVVSNKRGELLRAEAAHLGWDRYFSRLVGANDAERDKPDPRAVHAALAGTGFAPDGGVWFVGDTDTDMQCAANAGCTGVLIRAEPPRNGEFDAHPPAWYFRDCAAFAAHLGEYRGRAPG